MTIPPLANGGRGAVSGYQAVVEHLRREIALGRLSPGDKLPAERKLAELLGVSRETLRQALRVLEGAGEIAVQRGATGGAFVQAQAPDRESSLRGLRARREEFLELLQFRDIVESAAARLAAEAATPELLAELDESIQAMERATTLAESRRADALFHLAIAQGAGNEMLVRSVEDARVRMFAPVDALDSVFMKSSSVEAHQKIREAISTGDGEQAWRAMRQHLGITAAEFERLLAGES